MVPIRILIQTHILRLLHMAREEESQNMPADIEIVPKDSCLVHHQGVTLLRSHMPSYSSLRYDRFVAMDG